MSEAADIESLVATSSRPDVSACAASWALASIVGLLGTLVLHHPMIFSGFSRIQTDLGDARLLNYILEHGWLWIAGTAGHERFWEAPFFHPTPNVIAYSDSMLSYGPFYWPFRLCGAAPETAFGIWLVLSTILNYLAGLLFFRYGLKFQTPGAVAGAGLIAFGSPRVNQLGHAQLVPCFYVLVGLYALCRVFRAPTPGIGERIACWMGFGFAICAQLYGGVYVGWFFILGMSVVAGSSLILKSSRSHVIAILARDSWAIAVAAIVWMIAMRSFFTHYLGAAREFGGGFNLIQMYTHAESWSWWSVGDANWLWGWVERRWPIRGNPFPSEHHLGIGFLTTGACAVGLILGRRNPAIRTALMTLLVGLGSMTIIPAAEVVTVSAAAICIVLGNLFREPDWTERGAPAIFLATAVFLCAPPHNDVMRALTLVMMAFCFGRMIVRSGRIEEQLAPGAALALLSFHLLPAQTAATMGVVVAPAALAPAYFQPALRRKVALAAIGVALAATTLLAFESRPLILVGTALGATFGWEGSGLLRSRPEPLSLCKVLIITFVLVLLLNGHNSIWLAVSPLIPGFQAIRVPSRVALILLIPAAMGLARVVEFLHLRRCRIAAWGLILLCTAEQAGSTSTYEVAEGRARVAAVARRIDPRAGAFYYRPDKEESFIFWGLDSMWASLQVGIPTINGYSGGFPKGWFVLAQADAPDKPTTKEALEEWCRLRGLHPEEVQRIGIAGSEGIGEWLNGNPAR